MRAKALIIIVCTFLILAAGAQNNTADSLKALLSKANNDTTKVDLQLQISRAYYNSSWEEVIRYSNEAAVLSAELQYPKGEALAHKNIGVAHYFQGNPLEAVQAWEKSLQLYRQTEDKQGEANILSNLGGVYVLSDESKALDYYLKSLRLAEQIKDSFRIATLNNNIGALYDKKTATVDQAVENYRKAIEVSQKNNYPEALGMATGNIGEIYIKKNKFDSALYYLRIGEKNLQGKANLPLALNNIGKLFLKRENYPYAFDYHKRALDEASKANNKLYIMGALLGIADTYSKQQLYANALESYKKAEIVALELNSNDELRQCYEGMSAVYNKLGDFRNAYDYQVKLTGVREKIYNEQTDNKLSNLRFDFDLQNKENQISLLSRDKALQELELNRQKFAKNALIVGMVLVSLIIFILYRDYRTKAKVNRLLDSQKAEIETLLSNILPMEVAKELQINGTATPRYYESVSVLFTDFKSFTTIADHMSPQQVVAELNTCFIAFDNIVEKYKLEKIKTIGDAYMCAGGIPTPYSDHLLNMIKAAREILDFIEKRNEIRVNRGLLPWDVRIGIHIGPVVAGVVGKKKYAYDIWGSTVNIASRMESNGEPGQINLSETTYLLIKDLYHCTYRGKIYAKNVGEIDMYFLGDEKTEHQDQKADKTSIKV
jgi:adenylate cyclase